MKRVVPFLLGVIFGAATLLLYIVLERRAGWFEYKLAALQFVAKPLNLHEPEQEPPLPDKAFCSALIKELEIAPWEVNYLVGKLLDGPTGRVEEGELLTRWNDLGVIDKSRIVFLGLSDTDYREIETTIRSDRRFFKARDKLALALVPCRFTIKDWEAMSPIERQKLEYAR